MWNYSLTEKRANEIRVLLDKQKEEN